jgi:hypothetical protein
MSCILKVCAHAGAGRCKLLGECGASYVLDRAALPGGCKVMSSENSTIRALRNAGLITIHGDNGCTATVRAVVTKAKRKVA